MSPRSLLAIGLGLALAGCLVGPDDGDDRAADAIVPSDYRELNLAAGSMVLYEIQAQAANACDPNLGADWQRQACRDKPAPDVEYRAEGMSCPSWSDLSRIKLGTLDDLLADSADFRAGITVRYVQERVGANTLWLMPPFPNNDEWSLPHECDNLGSPYAVRDYMHVEGGLSRTCIAAGRDERSDEPCWGEDALERVIAQAHSRGMKVMLDVAFNHFGHNYQLYDYVDYEPVRDRLARGESPDSFWGWPAAEPGLAHPVILDTPEKLEQAAEADPRHRERLDALLERCPDLEGQTLVRHYNMWREAFDWERDAWSCDAPALEHALPGFYLGRDHWAPSTRLGDNFTNDWRDVKFLYHHDTNGAHAWEYARVREYLFRVVNYWRSRGVDGFRLDHTTDYFSGMSPIEWKYILGKSDRWAERRGQARGVFLAEEFGDQGGMDHVVDILTEGWLSDMAGRGGSTKDASYVERVLSNMGWFGRAYVMTALETHDEHRLVDGTGFDPWTGFGFWAIGAAQRGTPMLLMGQELGESWGLGFKRSDMLRSRFVGHPNYRGDAADALIDTYGRFVRARLDPRNRALLAPDRAFLRSRWTQQPDPRILAEVKWTSYGGNNVVFAFHNLWRQGPVEQGFYLEPDLASRLGIDEGTRYRLVDVVAGQPVGACRTGAELRWDLYVRMDEDTRVQWLRLERCP